jgi:hypothetical protein
MNRYIWRTLGSAHPSDNETLKTEFLLQATPQGFVFSSGILGENFQAVSSYKLEFFGGHLFRKTSTHDCHN